MGTSNNSTSYGNDDGSPKSLQPADGSTLYRYKNVDEMRTRNWHGYYWARRTVEGDFEIRIVPSSLGEPSMPGGVMPKEGFEKYYEKVDR